MPATPIVKQARDVARQWVIEEGVKTPGFLGAYLTGSTTLLRNDAVLSPSSDVDVIVVLADPPPVKLGKFIYRDVLLEVSYMSNDRLHSPDQMLGHEMAGSFKTAIIILDPSGRLSKLQALVSKDYAKRKWVRKRCEYTRDRSVGWLDSLNASGPFHDQVTFWLFGSSLTTYVLLMVGLKNPTVRRRYMSARELLEEYNRLDFYEALLEVSGFGRIGRMGVEQHLAATIDVFDVAKTRVKTPYRFASDISDVGRPIAIDGSRDLIERGYHREAIFYLVATYSRCQHVLYQDAPVKIQDRFNTSYRRLLGDLGITSFADLQQRAEQVKKFLPQVWEVAEHIMAANPNIAD